MGKKHSLKSSLASIDVLSSNQHPYESGHKPESILSSNIISPNNYNPGQKLNTINNENYEFVHNNFEFVRKSQQIEKSK
jgi:hypothetical protein